MGSSKYGIGDLYRRLMNDEWRGCICLYFTIGKKRFVFGEGSNDILYGGISIPQIFSPTIQFSNNKTIDIQHNPHFYALAGFYKFVTKESFFEPSLWIKYVKNVPPHLHLNIRYHLKNICWFGGGYSTYKTLHAETGFWIGNNIGWKEQKIKIGYAFDYSLGRTASFLGVAHEIHLTFLK
jgi:Type IX secretion system membrane protein PorP/SprF